MSMRIPPAADASHPHVSLERIAFGSCHSRGALDARLSAAKATNSSSPTGTVWDAIAAAARPHAFLWTGDAIYPPRDIRADTPLHVFRADTPLHVLQDEYRHMLYNDTLGYAGFVKKDALTGGVHGTWDDHDYGGNDRGHELRERGRRRDAYLNFLGVPEDDARRSREGLYGSVEFGGGSNDNGASKGRGERVRVIFLDTRWHRERHCIPSVGAHRYVPHGALVACLTRWIAAGLDLPSLLPKWAGCSPEKEMLGDEQWRWLEGQLRGSQASMHIVVSSVQVLTTNPAVESWGHFPQERRRLLTLLSDVPGLVILSGDVHHAEISTSNANPSASAQGDAGSRSAANDGAIVEITSSGLTHSCDGPFYGPLCRPLLDAFPSHRYGGGNVAGGDAPSYYTGRNFGSIHINWTSRSFTVHVHNVSGDVVLAANFDMDAAAGMSGESIEKIPKCVDGHFLPFLRDLAPSLIGCICIGLCICRGLSGPALFRSVGTLTRKPPKAKRV